MKLKLSLFFIFSFFYLYSSNAQFYSINSIYGISMRETSSICKDANGFIWTSSKTGVLRITEGDYRIYQLPYETADVVSVKMVYKKGFLLAYTNNGQLFVYSELYDRFNLLVDLRKVINPNYLVTNDIIVDNEGALWIATSAGLYRYLDDSLTLICEENIEIRRIALYDTDYISYATRKDVKTMNIKTSNVKFIYEGEVENTFLVSKFYYDERTGRLWIGTISSGLFYYDIKENTLVKSLIKNFPKQPILAIESNTDSTLLIGVDGQGIWELDKKGEHVLNVYKEDVDDPLSLRGDGVYDIFCDENGRVWVATYSGGLSFFEQESPLVNQITHTINTPNSLVNNHVNKIIEDKRGNIWFATNNGISCWKLHSNQWNNYYQNNQTEAKVFLALCEDEMGNIWGGTYSSGVYVLNGKTGNEIKHFSLEEPKDGFSGKFILDIFKDSEGDVWIGGVQSNVLCYQMKKGCFRSYDAQPVNAFCELVPGKILIACSYGLIVLDKENEKTETLLYGYLTQDALVIDNDIWVGTCGDGLILYNYENRTMKKFTTESGLLSNYVNSIIYANGYLWLGTENGLCRFNPRDYTVLTYSSIYSLSNLSFNVNSSCRLKNGDLMWGTNNGAVMFDPNMLYYMPLKGQIFFQDIGVSGRSIRENPDLILDTPVDKLTDISLRHTQNTLALELLPIGVSSAGTKFSWKMDGLDLDWSQPSGLQMITYTNMPSGNFRLKIRMYDSALSQIIDERSLDLHIIPPYWQTWWFRFIILLVIAGAMYFFFKIYINRIEQRHTEDKIRFFTNTAHDIRTSLTLINAPIEELNKEEKLSDKGRYYLNLASEQSGRLSFVATQLLDFQKVDVGKGQVFLVMTDIVNLVFRRKSMFEASAQKNNIELKFSSNRESYITAVDELKIEKVVDNLISNAIKYSHPAGKVEITLLCGGGKWILEVKDYGLGISEKAKTKLFREFYRGDNVVNSKMVGSGIGLLLVKNYVSMHNGEVLLESKENAGTSFRINIPYKKIESGAFSVGSTHNEKSVFDINSVAEKLNLSEKENVSGKKTHILIVEDNNDLQSFLKYSLQEHYMLSTADDGSEAWSMIQKKMPDLIISDVMMPNMDGLELCLLIKSTFETSHIPVILLTALSEKTQQLEGLGLGADDYITKPFDMSLLMSRIKSIVKNREIVRERVLKLIKKPDTDQPVLSNELNDQFVKKALEVVRENIANSEFGKDEFASAMNASSSLLYKKIKALTGQSPIDFIKAIRLDYSLELLQSRKYTVTEVSELCGFSSVGYFSTVFKKYFGKPPTEILG